MELKLQFKTQQTNTLIFQDNTNFNTKYLVVVVVFNKIHDKKTYFQ
jgi:hypothetical protein